LAIITKVNGFLEVNMDKIAITIFQGSVVTQTVLGESRQSYCNENRVQFFWPTLYTLPLPVHLYVLLPFV